METCQSLETHPKTEGAGDQLGTPGDWFIHYTTARQRSTVSNLSDCRCMSVSRVSRHEFDPDLVPYFHGDCDHEIISTAIFPPLRGFKKGCCQLQSKIFA